MYPRHAAFIEAAEDFAAAFFNISAPEAHPGPAGPPGRSQLHRQARAMDPQQRLVLETCYDSMLDSNMKQEERSAAARSCVLSKCSLPFLWQISENVESFLQRSLPSQHFLAIHSKSHGRILWETLNIFVCQVSL